MDGSEQPEPVADTEARSGDADADADATPENNEPSSKRQKLSHNTTVDQRDRKQGIAPIKPE